MSQNQKLWGRVETVLITASADRASSDFVHEGNWYGCCVDTIANGETGMLHVRGAFEITKNNADEVIASGDFIEYVDTNKVQKHDQGVKVGKAYEASGAGTAKVVVVLMPELY